MPSRLYCSHAPGSNVFVLATLKCLDCGVPELSPTPKVLMHQRHKNLPKVEVSINICIASPWRRALPPSQKNSNQEDVKL